MSACLPAYLYGRVSVVDVVLQVAHQHQVTGLVPARVQSVVVDVAEDRAGTDTVGAILGVDELAETVHDNGAVLPLALLLVLLGLKSRHDSANHTRKENLMVRRFIHINSMLSTYTSIFYPNTCLCHTDLLIRLFLVNQVSFSLT